MSILSHSSASRGRLKAIAASIAVLWVVLPAAAAIHTGWTAHTWCVAHQQLEHTRTAVAEPTPPTPVDGIKGAANHENGVHDGCALANPTTTTTTVTSQSTFVQPAQRVSEPAPIHDQVLAAPLKALLRAPKSSPPTAVL